MDRLYVPEVDGQIRIIVRRQNDGFRVPIAVLCRVASLVDKRRRKTGERRRRIIHLHNVSIGAKSREEIVARHQAEVRRYGRLEHYGARAVFKPDGNTIDAWLTRILNAVAIQIQPDEIADLSRARVSVGGGGERKS